MDDFPDYPCRGCGNSSRKCIGWQKCLKYRIWFGRWWGTVRRNAAEWRVQPAGDAENENMSKCSGEKNDAQSAK